MLVTLALKTRAQAPVVVKIVAVRVNGLTDRPLDTTVAVGARQVEINDLAPTERALGSAALTCGFANFLQQARLANTARPVEVKNVGVSPVGERVLGQA